MSAVQAVHPGQPAQGVPEGQAVKKDIVVEQKKSLWGRFLKKLHELLVFLKSIIFKNIFKTTEPIQNELEIVDSTTEEPKTEGSTTEKSDLENITEAFQEHSNTKQLIQLINKEKDTKNILLYTSEELKEIKKLLTIVPLETRINIFMNQFISKRNYYLFTFEEKYNLLLDISSGRKYVKNLNIDEKKFKDNFLVYFQHVENWENIIAFINKAYQSGLDDCKKLFDVLDYYFCFQKICGENLDKILKEIPENLDPKIKAEIIIYISDYLWQKGLNATNAIIKEEDQHLITSYINNLIQENILIPT